MGTYWPGFGNFVSSTSLIGKGLSINERRVGGNSRAYILPIYRPSVVNFKCYRCERSHCIDASLTRC